MHAAVVAFSAFYMAVSSASDCYVANSSVLKIIEYEYSEVELYCPKYRQLVTCESGLRWYTKNWR